MPMPKTKESVPYCLNGRGRELFYSSLDVDADADMPEEGRSPTVIRLMVCECPRRLENYSEVLGRLKNGGDVLLVCSS